MVGAIGIANALVSGKISSSNLPPDLNTVLGILDYSDIWREPLTEELSI
ncbi:MAG: hypothetical protein M1526_02245 [Candidatus Thermoplasmatota archaeon]|nr:hypothetical protein [Candidatus Thermoplasmatota archaeon]